MLVPAENPQEYYGLYLCQVLWEATQDYLRLVVPEAAGSGSVGSLRNALEGMLWLHQVARRRSSSQSGSVKENVDPVPERLSTPMVPPCPSTRPLVM
jgi:hypothetical protein